MTRIHSDDVGVYHGEIGRGGCYDELPTDPTLPLDKVAPATGASFSYHTECEQWLANPPPECCFLDPSLPGCTPAPCTYEQNVMAAEYEDSQYSLRPACMDFTSSGGSANFPWSELNGRGYLSSPPYGNPHYDNGGWGMIKSSLTNGLEATRSIYNRGGIALSGGYRCPHGNAQLPGAVPNSFHTHGRAADMYSADHGGKQWTLEECERLKDAVLQTNPILDEVLPCDRYADRHLHAAW